MPVIDIHLVNVHGVIQPSELRHLWACFDLFDLLHVLMPQSAPARTFGGLGFGQ